MSLYAQIVTFETFRQIASKFRLKKKSPEFMIRPDVPGTERRGEIQCDAMRKSYFQGQIGNRGRIIKDIGTQPALGPAIRRLPNGYRILDILRRQRQAEKNKQQKNWLLQTECYQCSVTIKHITIAQSQTNKRYWTTIHGQRYHCPFSHIPLSLMLNVLRRHYFTHCSACHVL